MIPYLSMASIRNQVKFKRATFLNGGPGMLLKAGCVWV